jgi:hypothetical protein
VDEEGPVKQYGFAYGTLREHAESGEEQFTVEWHKADTAVWYDILAFSCPQQLLARLGYPFARRLQKWFARDSAVAMRRAVVEAQINGSGGEGGIASDSPASSGSFMCAGPGFLVCQMSI